MNNKYDSVLKFRNYIVEEVEFKVNYAFSGADIDTVFDFDSSYEIEKDTFIQHLEVIIFPNAEKNNYPFTMNVKIAGLFEVEASCDENIKNTLIEQNSIAILYPYLRALTSIYSTNANIGTLVLPVINVVKYLKDKKKKSYDE